MRKLYLLFIILLLTKEIYPQWVQTNGPYSGRIYCFTVSPNEAGGNNLFAGTNDGIFLSTNNGTSWACIGLINTVVSSLATYDSKLFAGTNYGVFLSTDYGENWTEANNGLSKTYVYSLVVSDTNLFARTDEGIFLTTNNGANWTKVSTALTDYILSLAVSLNKSGETNLYAGTYGNAFLSTNNGISWTTISNGLPIAYYAPVSLAVNDTNLFAATDEDGIFLSTNNGINWTKISNINIVLPLIVFDTNLFASTLDGVFLSTNNGTSWTNIGLTDTFVYTLASIGSNLFAGTTTQGIFHSSNNGTSWTKTGLPNCIKTIIACGTKIFAGTNGNGVFRSADNGTNWIDVSTGLMCPFVQSLAVSGNNLFVAASGQFDFGVFISNVNGSNWQVANTPFKDFSEMIKNDTNLFAGTSGGVFLSTNHGTSWIEVSTGLPDTCNVTALAFSSTNLFAGTKNGIFFSTNNGTNWIERNNSLSNTCVTSLAVSGSNIFAATAGGIFLSTNNGTSWTKTNFTNTNLISITLTGTNLFACTEDSIFISTNNGASWDEVNSGLTNIKMIYNLAVSGTNLFAGTNGGMWKRPLSEMITDVKGVLELPKEFVLYQNYPNPFNPTTIIKYSIPTMVDAKIASSTIVELKVYNILGKEVATLVNEKKPTGIYEVTWNAANMSSGVYFYQLKSGSYSETKKMILLR